MCFGSCRKSPSLHTTMPNITHRLVFAGATAAPHMQSSEGLLQPAATQVVVAVRSTGFRTSGSSRSPVICSSMPRCRKKASLGQTFQRRGRTRTEEYFPGPIISCFFCERLSMNAVAVLNLVSLTPGIARGRHTPNHERLSYLQREVVEGCINV